MTRADLDRWALRSHELALKAIDDGRMSEEIVAVTIPNRKKPDDPTIVEVDEGPRRGPRWRRWRSSPAWSARRARTPPATPRASTTAPVRWCSPPTSGPRPTASSRWREIVAHAQSANDFAYLAMTPATAARKALRRPALQPGDIDLWEINEAFASVTLNSIRMLGIDEDRVNVNGGAVALGHPIGASGARILGSLAARAAPSRRRPRLRGDLLRRRAGRRADPAGLVLQPQADLGGAGESAGASLARGRLLRPRQDADGRVLRDLLRPGGLRDRHDPALAARQGRLRERPLPAAGLHRRPRRRRPRAGRGDDRRGTRARSRAALAGVLAGVLPRLYPQMLQRAYAHQDEGMPVYILTAASQEMADLLAHVLAFDGGLGSRSEIVDGRYTGRRGRAPSTTARARCWRCASSPPRADRPRALLRLLRLRVRPADAARRPPRRSSSTPMRPCGGSRCRRAGR